MLFHWFYYCHWFALEIKAIQTDDNDKTNGNSIWWYQSDLIDISRWMSLCVILYLGQWMSQLNINLLTSCINFLRNQYCDRNFIEDIKCIEVYNIWIHLSNKCCRKYNESEQGLFKSIYRLPVYAYIIVHTKVPCTNLKVCVCIS